jgi:hypothetical protein
MSHEQLVFHPGKEGRPAGTRIVEVKAVEPIEPTLTGPVARIDALLDAIMLWVYVGEEGGEWFAYCSDVDPELVAPESLDDARHRAQFAGHGPKSADARRALGTAVIAANLHLQRSLKPPRTASAPRAQAAPPKPEAQDKPEAAVAVEKQDDDALAS